MSNTLTIGSAYATTWSAADTDIDGLLPGTASGSLFEAPTNAHFTIGLNDNDVNDSFSIVSGGGNWSVDSTYDTVIAFFGANGEVGIGNSAPASALDVTGDITVSGTVDGKDIATNAAMLNEAETITADWVNTANPWADNEVSDTITVGAAGSVNVAALPATVILDTEIDSCSELAAITGTTGSCGSFVLSSAPVLTGLTQVDEIIAGEDSGGVALTINDGYGNANLTFNHRDGTPDQSGSANRIEAAVDGTTGSFSFEIGDNVTIDTPTALTQVMLMTTSAIDAQVNLDANAGLDVTGDLTLVGSASNISLGSNWLSGDGGDEGIYVDASGIVGIGTNAGLEGDLTIADYINMRRNSDGWLIKNERTDNSQETGLYVSGHSGDVGLEVYAGGSGSVANFKDSRITFSQNVGIGTTSPESLLALSSTGKIELVIDADTDNITETDNARIVMRQDGGAVTARMGYADNSNTIEIMNEYNDSLHLGTTNTSRLTISGSGVVNIANLTASRLVATDASKNLVSTITEANLESSVSGVSNIFTNNDTITTANIADSYVLNTGDTMTGILTISPTGNGAIELGRTDGVASTPFVDFHSGATAVDYDSRIIASGGSGSSGGGSLTITTNSLTVSGNTDFSSGIDVTGNITVTGTVDGKDIATNAGMLNEAETITGNWVNTANPWADNEVSDTITVGASGSVNDSALSANVLTLGGGANGNSFAVGNYLGLNAYYSAGWKAKASQDGWYVFRNSGAGAGLQLYVEDDAVTAGGAPTYGTYSFRDDTFIAPGNVDVGGGLDVTGNITVTGTVDGKDIATNAGMLNEAETVSSNWTFNSGLTIGSGAVITSNTDNSRDKLRVWNSSNYTIGMDPSYTYGGLGNSYAMTFQMNNDSTRGFWWGDTAHTNAQGAMSLTTDGQLTVANSLRLGYGESDASAIQSGYDFQVAGASYFADVINSFNSISVDSTNAHLRLEYSDTAISDGERAGYIDFAGNDLSNVGVGARIQAQGDGATGILSLGFLVGTSGGTLGEALYLDGSSKRAGVNNSNPLALLHVGDGSNTLVSTAGAEISNFTIEADTTNSDKVEFRTVRVSTGSDWGTASHEIIRRVDSTDMGFIRLGNYGADGDLITFGETNTEYMRIDGDGDVGIGELTPAYKLEVGGGDVNTLAGGYRDAGTCVAGTCASDANLKTNIESITNALTIVSQLNPVTFEFNDSLYGSGTQYGLIAQELEALLPQFVGTSTDGYKTVSYGLQFQSYALAAIGDIVTIIDMTNASTTQTAMTIDSLGNISIGSTTNPNKLTAHGAVQLANFGAGTLQVDALGNVMVSSDERLKDIGGEFTTGLDAVLGIQPIQYHWKAETGFDTEGVYTGFSAQNIEALIPEAVSYDKNGFRTLSDRTILATVINAIKEMWDKITDTDNRVSELEAENESLRIRLEAIEDALGDKSATQSSDQINSQTVNSNVSNETNSEPVVETVSSSTTDTSSVDTASTTSGTVEEIIEAVEEAAPELDMIDSSAENVNVSEEIIEEAAVEEQIVDIEVVPESTTNEPVIEETQSGEAI